MKKRLTKAWCIILVIALLVPCVFVPTIAETAACPTIGNYENLVPDTLAGDVTIDRNDFWQKEAISKVSGDTWYISQTVSFSSMPTTEFLYLSIGQAKKGTEKVNIRMAWQTNSANVYFESNPGEMYSPFNWGAGYRMNDGTNTTKLETDKKYTITAQVIDGDKLSVWIDDKQILGAFSLKDFGLTDAQPSWGCRAYVGFRGTISSIKAWDGTVASCPTIGSYDNLVPDKFADGVIFHNSNDLVELNKVSGNTWNISQTIRFSSTSVSFLDVAVATGTVNGEKVTVRVQLLAGGSEWYVAGRSAVMSEFVWTNQWAHGNIDGTFEVNRDYVLTVQIINNDELRFWIDGHCIGSMVSLAQSGCTDLKPAWGYRGYGIAGTISNIQVWDGTTVKCPAIGDFANLAPDVLSGEVAITDYSKIWRTTEVGGITGNTWYVSQTVNFATATGKDTLDIAVGVTGEIEKTEKTVRVQLLPGGKECRLATGTASINAFADVLVWGNFGETFDLNRDYTITVRVVDGDELSYWIDGKLILSGYSLKAAGFTDLRPAWGYRGYSLIGATIRDIQFWDGETRNPEKQDVLVKRFADITPYRSGDYTAPAENGYVFAGWFTDEACTRPITVETANVYARYVTEDVLSVKAQLLDGTATSSEITDYRFVTTVDSLVYQQVGFDITINGKTKNLPGTSVYKTIKARKDGQTVALDPTVFSAASQYFHAFNITNIPKTAFRTDIRVSAFWKTADGTVVYGPERTFTVISGVYGGKKLVALTFDDGPKESIFPAYLKLMQQYNWRSTFFVLGGRVNGQPQMLADGLAAGMEYANHSFSHTNFDTLTAEQIQNELQTTADAIDRASDGKAKITCARLPTMIDNDSVYEAAKDFGYVWVGSVRYDIMDGGGFENITPVSDIANKVLDSVYDGAIYCMHEAPNTLEALKRVILPVLEQRGYACVTVSEILEAKGATNLPNNYSIRDAYLAKTDEEVAVNMQKYR